MRVTDEGKTYKGRPAIKGWIEKSNEETHSVMTPLEYQELPTQNILLAEVSGNFNGSPIVLKLLYPVVLAVHAIVFTLPFHAHLYLLAVLPAPQA